MSLLLCTLWGISLLWSCGKKNGAPPKNQDTLATLSGDSFFEQFRRKGIDFYATGNEPFWVLEVDHTGGLGFRLLDGIQVSFTGDCAPAPLPNAEGYTYSASTPAGKILVTVLRKPCIDSMSGDTITYQVTVQIDQPDNTRRSFQGCGRYLNDPQFSGVWTLTALDGRSIDTVGLTKGPPTLQLSPKDYRIWGHGSCNNYFGVADVMGDRIAITDRIGSTLMACPRMELENTFFKTLSGKTFLLSINDRQLLFLEDQKPIMQWVRSKD
ncbi:MAG: META domain-containing protein [Chitinophagales bacterium]|nr:META domain-containing protein [Chitinophagales bacterium]MDW8428075.1 META domain-containing protein [Chitinophagales bacterium]